jgi:hypothetical protein
MTNSRDRLCATCAHEHNRSFSEKWCSASCQWIYFWRRRHGYQNPD